MTYNESRNVQHLEELPLFPLNAVLFPHAQLQLHIFEERYRLMINRCVETDTPFGIVLIRNGNEVGEIAEPYLVGTAVRLLGVHRYDDGRLDIQVQGERRFRIRELDESQPYLVGRVEPVVEMEWEDSFENRDVVKRAQEDCSILVKRRFEQQGFSVRVMFPEDPTDLSFTIANLLTMNNLEKQRLLETTDTRERMLTLIPMLERQMIEATGPRHFRLTADMVRDELFNN